MPDNVPKFEFSRSALTEAEQAVVAEGFRAHTDELGAPHYEKQRLKWICRDDQGELRAVLTADVLWDWVYIDELWVSSELRGQGVGKNLVSRVEQYAMSEKLKGIWLWTQSWQAVDFYSKLGFVEFARFDDFPRGHIRVGFRKELT